MVRRFFRIAPLYYLAIPFYYFVATFFSNGQPAADAAASSYTWPAIVLNLLFLNGLVPSANNSVVPGGWSIGCEFLFYSGFPFLFFLSRADKRVLLAIVLVSALVTSALCLFCAQTGNASYLGNNEFLYFFISNQMPCFVLGMVYFFWAREGHFRKLLWALAIPAGLGLIAAQHASWGWVFLPALMGLLSVAVALLIEKLSFPYLLRQIGEKSFSIYILHFAVINFLGGFYLFRLPAGLQNSFTAIVFYLAAVVITFLLSCLTYTLIEKPLIDFGHALAVRVHPKTVTTV